MQWTLWGYLLSSPVLLQSVRGLWGSDAVPKACAQCRVLIADVGAGSHTVSRQREPLYLGKGGAKAN